jgi:hypothetical protein
MVSCGNWISRPWLRRRDIGDAAVIKQLAPQHPEWKDKEPFASLLKGDTNAALAGGDGRCSRWRWPRTRE